MVSTSAAGNKVIAFIAKKFIITNTTICLSPL